MGKTDIFAIVGSVLLLLFVIELIRKKKIKEEYSLLWIFSSIIFVILSLWREGLEYIAQFMGVAYPPTALLLVLIIAVFLILIQFSILISKLSENNKRLIQEIALLRNELLKKIEKDEQKKEN